LRGSLVLLGKLQSEVVFMADVELTVLLIMGLGMLGILEVTLLDSGKKSDDFKGGERR